MKPGALLVNVARGPIVDEVALVEALRLGHLGGAALDVFRTEPLAADSPLVQMPHVLLTPHCVGHTHTLLQRVRTSVLSSIETVAAGGVPRLALNPEAARRHGEVSEWR
jgi:D-3-phosphoglycerate dehydrogenase